MNKEGSTFFIVRHGETDWNARRLLQGQTDIPLNKKGEDQARKVAAQLEDVHFDAIFSSDLLRARQTAEIIAEERQMVVETNEMLREQHFGDSQGKTVEEFLQLLTQWKELSEEEKAHYTVGEGMESNEQAVTRLITILHELGSAYRGKTVLIVAHGGIMRYLLVKLGVGSLAEPLFMKNTGYIKLTSDGLDFTIEEINGTEDRKRND